MKILYCIKKYLFAITNKKTKIYPYYFILIIFFIIFASEIIEKKTMKKNECLRLLLLSILLFYKSISAFSINYSLVVGARSAALAHASVALKDPFAVFNNPAMMAYSAKIGIGLHYENRFLLKETSTSCLGVMIPFDKNGVFGIHILHFGYVNYGELNAGLSYAKSFGNVFAFGLKFDYLLNYFGEETYGKCSGFTFDIGMYGQITKSFGIGFHVFNPARLKMCTYNDTKEYIPTIFRLGLIYTIAKKCMLTVEAEKDLETNPLYRLGFEYGLNEHFYLRTGISFPDVEYALGVGWKMKSLSVDFSSNYHSVLGYSPQLSLIYNIK